MSKKRATTPSERREPIPVCVVAHDDHWFLGPTLDSYRAAGPATVFVSRRAWNGTDGPWERVAEVARGAGAEVVEGDWPDESMHRRAALAEMKRRGHRFVLIPDGDEVIEPSLLDALLRAAGASVADRVYVHMDTFWKGPNYVIRPRESLTPILMLNAQNVEHHHIRDYWGGTALTLSPEHGVLYHLSYAGPDERIERKIATWGHRSEVGREWRRRVWQGWDRDRLMRDLHPTHPACYGFAERIEVPDALKGVADDRPRLEEPSLPTEWPKVSVVIPLYGGEEDIRLCLESLGKAQDLLHEVIVVDDASPDDAPDVVGDFAFARLILNERNMGFGATCNKGLEASTGDVVLFLNSDTYVPRAGLIRLVESLMDSRNVGAAGPMTNESGYGQRVPTTFTGISTVELFARDFAHRSLEDADTDMLVGFCLAVRRSALDDVGAFDERFGIGMFEDNDLCYRLRSAGYRLVVSTRSFVYHAGSRSIGRAGEHPALILERNQRAFEAKWREDVETGFASHLSGQSAQPIAYVKERRPDRVRRRVRELAQLAQVSLCMIVRNEERVLGECLDSVAGAFAQTIVVDTGSTDRTREIAIEHGAELYEIQWPDSFSAARNESLKHAKGRWVMWMDADDTLPLPCAETILSAVVDAPDDVTGFVVPVQFVEEGPGGTRVDHLKVFRNLPGVEFVGRIHEQVLPSLRALGGRVARLEAVVLHSGYDASEEGQRRKRERDWPLLLKDLEEEPNNPFRHFNVGMTHHFSGEHEQAIESLKRSIELSEPTESHLRKAYALLGVSVRELGDLEGALRVFEEGLTAVGEDPELRFQAGVVLTRLGRLEEARASYLLVRDDPEHFSSVDRAILGYKLHHNLGSVCMGLDRYKEGRDHWCKAVQEAPLLLASAVELFEAAMTMGDFPTAGQALESICRADRGGELWASAGCRLVEAIGQNPEGWLVAKCREFSGAVGPRLLLARRLLERGDAPGALPLLQELAALRNPEGAFLLGVHCSRFGDFEAALNWMRLAMELNPSHLQTREQVARLEALLADAEPCRPLGPPCEEARGLLKGPHAGALGAPSRRASVVVVAFDSERTISACLDSALRTMDADDELIVVDNASADRTREVLGRYAHDRRLRVMLNEDNVGYSRAFNQGALASSGKFVVALNPDCAVFPCWIEGMVERIEAGYAAVGPVSFGAAGRQFECFHLPPEGSRPDADELPEHLRKAQRGETLEARFLGGFCLMASREALDEHGLLDEGLPLGADDLELSWRLRQLGLRLAVCRDVYVRHDAGTSFASARAAEAREWVRRSDEALVRKLRAYYGESGVPTSRDLWGCDVFREALERNVD